MNKNQMEAINARLEKLEKQDVQDLLTLLEILSSATFFGKMKKTDCPHAKRDQCSLYIIKKDAKNKIPLATECRNKDCSYSDEHCHLEISNITCSFCPERQTRQDLIVANNLNLNLNESNNLCLKK